MGALCTVGALLRAENLPRYVAKDVALRRMEEVSHRVVVLVDQGFVGTLASELQEHMKNRRAACILSVASGFEGRI